jgi:preprotein translocase subunit SecA
MFGSIIKKIVGTKNDRELNRLAPLVDQINDLEPEIRKLGDAQLRAKTFEFKQRLADGTALDELLPEAFAVAREASVRVLGMRPFDVQVIGGIVLHEGKIAEMKTGEGKTLAAVLPVYLNALTGEGVHVVTVNDYLARRDSRWMGDIYQFLGLSVGVILHDLDKEQRRKAYGADVTYGTNNEFGFDYLRDNMEFSLDDYVQRPFHYAIVDEVDSILIDEARTPLIISGSAEGSTSLYDDINRIIPRLQKERDYTVEEKTRTAVLTEDGVGTAEKMLKVENLYDPRNILLVHHLNQALKAHALFKRDVDYIVKDDEVVIVDEFTGRLMPGRRYSEGLHQALEAKEGVKVENENQTLATITFQNYFRMYKKLAGMTGTADTEAPEFNKIYKLDVMVIPTHQKMIRDDFADVIYRNEAEKFKAVVEEIKELHVKGQPVLVGTISIEKSERLSRAIAREGVKHSVLNAKNHALEAEIVSQAGQKGVVTISTNMAGRGTDIVLGEGVTALGGLHILGTERHESRRIDNQLRGRSGRQGDPGSSRFYLSLEDDLLRIFGSDRIAGLMDKMGMSEGEPIEHQLISKAIENAQRRVEGHNFEIRKHLLDFDNVMNQQREVIYEQRRTVLEGQNLRETIQEMNRELVDAVLDAFLDEKVPPEEWDLKAMKDKLFSQFNLHLDLDARPIPEAEELRETIQERVWNRYLQKVEAIGPEVMASLEQMVMLQTIDTAWKDHLLSMDHLKEGIGLRGYGQRDPLREYQREGYEMFVELIERIKEQTVANLMRVQLAREEDVQALAAPQERPVFFSHGGDEGPAPKKRENKKIGRNDPCTCGSGKKYKKCCGRNK